MKRLRTVRLLRRDWVGYAVIVLLCGGVLLVAVFLPWANTDTGHSVNFSLSKPDAILGVMHTRWGVPALLIALAVTLLGVVMLALRPRRYSLVLGFLLAAAGAGSFALADNAAAQIGSPMRAGIGLYVTLFVGVILVPIGLATAIIALVLARGYGAGPPDSPGHDTRLARAPLAPAPVAPLAPILVAPLAPPAKVPISPPADAPVVTAPDPAGRSTL
jgi:hypothetical protein